MQVGENDQISAATGRNRAEMMQTEVIGSVDRAEANRRDRINPIGDSDAHHMINRAFINQAGRHAVVGAEAEAAVILHVDQRQQRAQIVRGRAFANEDGQAEAQLFAGFIDGGAFVIAVDPSSDISVERLAPDGGAVTIEDAIPEQIELVEDAFIAVDHAGIVHHLGEAEHPLIIEQRREILALRGARRWFPCRWRGRSLRP